MASRLSADYIEALDVDPRHVGQTLETLEKLGFRTSARGRLTASIRGDRKLFEKVFGTKLKKHTIDKSFALNCQSREVYFPGEDAPWNPQSEIEDLLDDAYIQWPHIYLNNLFPADGASPIAPRVNYHHLRAPGDIAALLNAARVHREGGTGQGVRVAMIDSGFAHDSHPYFAQHGYRTTSVLAAGATDVTTDKNGHGTGESANILAIAPNVDFVGIKLDNDTNPSAGASVLEGFQEALIHEPDVISVSLGYDLVMADGNRTHRSSLPNSLVALEAEIKAAVNAGVVVVFSAGNGHVAFPGMMPDVLSAGGVYVNEAGEMHASDYASAFRSRIYPSRNVPDVSGLVGLVANGASYIMLPVAPGCDLDRRSDDTSGTDGWGVFSGTSAAAPQLAGVCALLLERDPTLSPEEIKSLLRRTSRDVVLGAANPSSNQRDGGLAAGQGADSATGSGLVDAFAAWRQLG
jgi:subtilisin family serine protease